MIVARMQNRLQIVRHGQKQVVVMLCIVEYRAHKKHTFCWQPDSRLCLLPSIFEGYD